MFLTCIRTFLLVFCLCSSWIDADEKENSQPPLVLVTVAPHKYLVERIAGKTVRVKTIVPSTANVHTFEPSPKQMMELAEADLWFRIGEFFEKHLEQALQSHRPSLRVVDLRQGLDLIYSDQLHGSCCRHGDGMDLHFWLSPRQLKIQATTVANQLIARYPEHEAAYRKALEEHLKELDRLDRELRLTLTPVRGHTFLVVHPAYGYFCRDYKLRQLSVEIEGKDPAPQQLTKLLQQAQKLQLKTVFLQAQYSPKVAELVKAQLGEGAKVEMLDPYAEDYMNNMRAIAQAFVQA